MGNVIEITWGPCSRLLTKAEETRSSDYLIEAITSTLNARQSLESIRKWWTAEGRRIEWSCNTENLLRFLCKFNSSIRVQQKDFLRWTNEEHATAIQKLEKFKEIADKQKEVANKILIDPKHYEKYGRWSWWGDLIFILDQVYDDDSNPGFLIGEWLNQKFTGEYEDPEAFVFFQYPTPIEGHRESNRKVVSEITSSLLNAPQSESLNDHEMELLQFLVNRDFQVCIKSFWNDAQLELIFRAASLLPSCRQSIFTLFSASIDALDVFNSDSDEERALETLLAAMIFYPGFAYQGCYHEQLDEWDFHETDWYLETCLDECTIKSKLGDHIKHFLDQPFDKGVYLPPQYLEHIFSIELSDEYFQAVIRDFAVYRNERLNGVAHCEWRDAGFASWEAHYAGNRNSMDMVLVANQWNYQNSCLIELVDSFIDEREFILANAFLATGLLRITVEEIGHFVSVEQKDERRELGRRIERLTDRNGFDMVKKSLLACCQIARQREVPDLIKWVENELPIDSASDAPITKIHVSDYRSSLREQCRENLDKLLGQDNVRKLCGKSYSYLLSYFHQYEEWTKEGFFESANHDWGSQANGYRKFFEHEIKERLKDVSVAHSAEMEGLFKRQIKLDKETLGTLLTLFFKINQFSPQLAEALRQKLVIECPKDWSFLKNWNDKYGNPGSHAGDFPTSEAVKMYEELFRRGRKSVVSRFLKLLK